MGKEVADFLDADHILIMLAPIFGFSLGDFISGIGLLIEIFQSLNEANGAQAEYKELWRELTNIKNGLESVQKLSLDHCQSAQASAVENAVNDCLSCIDGFMQRNKKYCGLGSTPVARWSSAGFRTSVRMVQWALWKKADLVKFKSEVQQHTAAIQMLLGGITM